MKFTNGFKRFTKKMSAVLAAALSVSAITVPQVFAAKVNNMPQDYEWQNIVSEDFENVADMTEARANGLKLQSDESSTIGFMSIGDSGDADNGKSFRFLNVQSGTEGAGSPGMYYSLPQKMTSGEIKVSFSMKSSQKNWIPMYLMQETDKPSENTQNVITFQNNNTYTLLGTPLGYTADKWVDVTLKLNLDAKKFDITLSGEGVGNGAANEKKFVRYENKDLTIDGFAGIQFRSWHQATGDNTTYTYIDNIKVAEKQYGTTNTAYVKQDFSNIRSFSELTADGWTWTHDQKTVDAKIVNVDESHGNALQLSQNGPGVYTSLKDKNGNAFSSGKYEVKFSIYPKDEKTKIYVDMNDVILCYFDEYNGLGRSTSVAGEARYSAGKWYDVSAVMNLAEQKGTVVVTQGDTTVWTKDFTYDKNVFSQLRIRSWNDKAFYIDDIMVKNYVEPKPSTVLIDENFDNMTELSNGWTNIHDSNPVTIIDNSPYGKSAKGQFKGSSGLQKSFDAVTGQFKISFLMKTNTQFYLDLINKNAEGVDAVTKLLFVDTSLNVLPGNSPTAGDNNYTNGTLESEKYYQFEFIVDIDNKKYEMSYTDVATSTRKAISLDTSKLARLSNLNSVSGIKLGFWDRAKDGSDTVIIDNVKAERIVTAPVLSAETVAIKDYNENVITDTTKVTPAISEIALNFGTQIDEATLDGAITITDSDNSTVAFDYALSSDGKIVTITPTAYLKGGKTYSLSVAKTVANVYDMTMDAAFNMKFETAADFAKAELTTLPKLSDITTGSTVTIGGNFINCTDSSKNLVWVVAYFSDNRLVYADASKETPISAVYGKTTLGQTYTAPDMTGVDRVEVYLWNGMTTMIPFADATPIQ